MDSLILGAGFIGCHLAQYLLGQGVRVTVFTRSLNEQLSSLQQQGCKVVIGEFSQPQDYVELLAGVDIVYHLISTTVPKTSNDNPVYDINSNLCSTVQLLEAVSKCHTDKQPKIIYVSSGGTVYGTPEYLPLDEKHKTDPVCSYGVVKLAIEKYLHMYSRVKGLKYVVLRLSNPYGEYIRNDNLQGIIPVCLQKILQGSTIEIWGDGSAVRDYLHVDDVVEALYGASFYQGERKLFNIGSGVGTSILELLDLMKTVTDTDVKATFVKSRGCDIDVNYLDNNLARKELAWTPAVSLETGMQKVCRWLDLQ